jgi:hypothetical protein
MFWLILAYLVTIYHCRFCIFYHCSFSSMVPPNLATFAPLAGTQTSPFFHDIKCWISPGPAESYFSLENLGMRRKKNICTGSGVCHMFDRHMPWDSMKKRSRCCSRSSLKRLGPSSWIWEAFGMYQGIKTSSFLLLMLSLQSFVLLRTWCSQLTLTWEFLSAL